MTFTGLSRVFCRKNAKIVHKNNKNAAFLLKNIGLL